MLPIHYTQVVSTQRFVLEWLVANIILYSQIIELNLTCCPLVNWINSCEFNEIIWKIMRKDSKIFMILKVHSKCMYEKHLKPPHKNSVHHHLSFPVLCIIQYKRYSQLAKYHFHHLQVHQLDGNLIVILWDISHISNLRMLSESCLFFYDYSS